MAFISCDWIWLVNTQCNGEPRQVLNDFINLIDWDDENGR